MRRCPAEKVRVGLFDTRIAAHEQLEGSYLAGPDAVVAPTAPGRPRLWWEGHATFIAGIIRRHAPSAVLDVRTALLREPDGAQERWTMPLWTFAERLAEYQDAGVEVLNLSVGVATGDGRPPLVLQRAIAQLTPSMVVVAAAGNHGMGGLSDEERTKAGLPARGAALFPAALDDVLAVGALDGQAARPGRRGVHATRGTRRRSTAPWIDVFAPGVETVSTYLGDADRESVLVRDADGHEELRRLRRLGVVVGYVVRRRRDHRRGRRADGAGPHRARGRRGGPAAQPASRGRPRCVTIRSSSTWSCGPAAGDQRAWDEIVERFAPLVWGICMRHRLSPADADDVGQSVWLGLLEHLQTIREPAALPGWIATTTRRECLRLHDEAQPAARCRWRARTADDDLGADPTAVPVDEGLLIEELRAAVRAAFARLAPHCRRLLALLVSDPPLPYVRIAEILDVPVGGLGPTRARCLEKLRRSEALAAFLDGARGQR